MLKLIFTPHLADAFAGPPVNVHCKSEPAFSLVLVMFLVFISLLTERRAIKYIVDSFFFVVQSHQKL